MYPFRKTPRYIIINNINNISIEHLSIEQLQISKKVDNQDHVNQNNSGLINRVNFAASLATLASVAISILPIIGSSMVMLTPLTSSVSLVTITIH